jgi:NADPH:quinone reductase-like Zn-dependent oxidoreductase
VLSGLAIYLGLKLRPDGRRARLYAITASAGAGWRHCRDDWTTLLELKRRGEVDPLVGATVPFTEVRRAHELMDAAAVTGKIVLTLAS